MRELLRPLRDQILRLSGFVVESTCDYHDGLMRFYAEPFDLVLIDVEGEAGVQPEPLEFAQQLCSTIKSSHPHQLIAFVCNWRVAIHTDCPDVVLRTEFDPAAFVAGVRDILVRGKAPALPSIPAL